MSTTLHTVLAWHTGDTRPTPVGPTSTDRQLLRGTLAAARERFAGAEIAPWSWRARTVTQIKGWADARRREAAAEDAADRAVAQ
jgi:hypothetical protein